MKRLLLATLISFLAFTGGARAYVNLEAEDFQGAGVVKTGNDPAFTSNGALRTFLHNGSASRTANLPNSSTLVVVARGAQGCDGWPHMVVAVDGLQVLSTYVDRSAWAKFVATPQIDLGSHTITVTYDNDYQTATCDRNLRVDVVRVHVWKGYSASSPYNLPATKVGTITSGNPYASQFTSYSSGIELTQLNGQYNKPTYFAKPGDPTTSTVSLTTDWSPTHDLKWDGRPIPIPSGCTPAYGSDGHLTIISPDRRRAWEFWRATRCSSGGITAAVISQWDLTGIGYPTTTNSENSARGSGTSLIPTTVRGEEALYGFDHAVGCTVPNVSSSYIYPIATHTDGGSASIKYGMRFVLRSAYPETGSVGRVNLIRALKTYGCYIVDQGASFEIDTDNLHPELWQAAGVSTNTLSDITPADLRYVSLGG
jgi:hypothetical protein